eukprot:gene25733-1728_t
MELFMLLGCLAVVVIVVVSLILQFGKKNKDLVLLVGMPGAGKSSLFYQLISGSYVNCATSQTPSEAVAFLSSSNSGSSGAKRTLLDYPGHHRLHSKLKTILSERTTRTPTSSKSPSPGGVDPLSPPISIGGTQPPFPNDYTSSPPHHENTQTGVRLSTSSSQILGNPNVNPTSNQETSTPTTNMMTPNLEASQHPVPQLIPTPSTMDQTSQSTIQTAPNGTIPQISQHSDD